MTKVKKTREDLKGISEEEALILLEEDSIIFHFFPERLLHSREFMEPLIVKNGYLLCAASKEMQDDKVLALKAIKSNSYAIQYLSDRLKEDKDVGLAAVKASPINLRYLGKKLLNDKEIVLESVKNNPNILEFADYQLRDDEEVVIAAARSVDLNNHSLESASNRLKKKREVVAELLQHKFPDAKNLATSCSSDRDFYLEVTKQYTSILRYAPKEFKDDQEIVIESIKKEQMDASYMSERLKDDENVIKTAIDCNSHNLRHASERLKDNKDFVLYAIHKSGHTYQFISPRLKEDRGILLEAFKNYEFLMDKLPKHLQEEIGENDPVEYLESYLLKEKFKD